MPPEQAEGLERLVEFVWLIIGSVVFTIIAQIVFACQYSAKVTQQRGPLREVVRRRDDDFDCCCKMVAASMHQPMVGEGVAVTNTHVTQ